MPILLNPGPVNLSARVRQALLRPDLCHREAEFSQLQNRIRDQLLSVYGLDRDRWAAVLLTGSGTAAVEAMVATLIPQNGTLLVIENGVYGERLSKIALIHGIDTIILRNDWGKQIDIQQLETLLDKHPDITHLGVVHHETTTGLLNPLAQLASIAQARYLHLLVDGVSSFGAEEIDFEDWGIAACAATANKCLHGVPGVSFTILRRDVLPPEEILPRTLYLDLATYCRQQDQGGTPFTQSVQVFYALNEALQELEDRGGWRARQDSYQQLMNFARDGLSALGILPLLPSENSSVVLNAFHLPKGISYETLHNQLKEKGFIIYSGQGKLTQSIFRISTMGAITFEDIERFLAIVKDI